MTNQKLITCVCGDVSHQLVVEYDEQSGWNDCIVVYVHLSDMPFWKRVKYAFLYILGKKSKFGTGAFEEVILDKTKANELIGTLLGYYHQMPMLPVTRLAYSDLTLDKTVL